MMRPGAVVLLESGGSVTVTERLSVVSGQGDLWKTRCGRLLKVFKDPETGAVLAPRLRALLSKRLAARLKGQQPWVVPVQAIALDSSGSVIGYLMPFLPGQTLAKVLFESQISWEARWILAFNLALLIDALHDESVVVLDLKPANVLVQDDLLLTLLDLDALGFSEGAEVFDSGVATRDYRAPETFRNGLFARGKTYDRWSLAVILYEILLMSTPFGTKRGETKKSPEQLIGDGDYVGRIPSSLFPRESYLHPAEQLPPEVAALFTEAFVSGHAVPSRRPSARRWVRTLDRAFKRELVRCRRGHHHAAQAKACVWCELEADGQFLVAAERPRRVKRLVAALRSLLT